MVKSGDYFIFPGGGTQFKDGVAHYIDSIEKVAHPIFIALLIFDLHYSLLETKL